MDIAVSKLDPALIDRFAAIVGARHALTEPADIVPFVEERRGLFPGVTGLVLRPGSVDEVSRILKLATETRTPVVPQGGNTGLVGAQMPDRSGREIVLSLSRLNRIRELDPLSNTITAEAGVVLETLHEAADAADRLFPLSLASQGSCQIGGNLSSNAGGTGVLAYGNARELCLGVEVVLPTGEVLDDLRKLKKDNTGYDLKNLFVGAEGTLGVITAAVLKLFPKPKGKEVAWAGVASPEMALALFGLAEDRAGRGAHRLRADRRDGVRLRAEAYARRRAAALRRLAVARADGDIVRPLGGRCARARRGYFDGGHRGRLRRRRDDRREPRPGRRFLEAQGIAVGCAAPRGRIDQARHLRAGGGDPRIHRARRRRRRRRSRRRRASRASAIWATAICTTTFRSPKAATPRPSWRSTSR